MGPAALHPAYARQQRTFLTLWCIFPSPLMVGGDLPRADAWTTALLTNPEVIAVDQHSTGNHPAIATDTTVVWVAQSTVPGSHSLAVFNLTESSQKVRYAWKDLGLTGEKYKLRDLWQRKNLGPADSLTVNLPPHGSILYGVSPVETGAR